jgi:hypothetical protein
MGPSIRIDCIVDIASLSSIESSVGVRLIMTESSQRVKEYGPQRIISAAQKLQMIKSQRLV